MVKKSKLLSTPHRVARVAIGAVLVAATSLAMAQPAYAIRGGEPVRQGEYPFIVEMQGLDTSSGQWRTECTASLIDPRAILTAAHCMPGVYPGSDDDEIRFVFERVSVHDPIQRVVGADQFAATIVNPEFRLSPNRDTAVVILDEPISGIEPVKLAASQDGLHVGDSMTAAGWGKIDDGSITEDLRSVQIPVVACNDVQPDNLCAGDWTAGANPGDSGGPGFVADGSGAFVQYGVVSGVTTGDLMTTVYTDLTKPDVWEPMRDQLAAAGFEHLIPTPVSAVR